MKFFSVVFKWILAPFQRGALYEPTRTFFRTGQPGEKIPEYIIMAFEDNPEEYLTPYQVALYHPLVEEKPEKALSKTVNDLDRLIKSGWLKTSVVLYPIRKVIIPGWIYTSLEQEIRSAEKEKKERFGFLHGHIHTDSAHVEDLTDTTVLEEKGFFKSRDLMGLSFSLKPHHLIGKNLHKWLNLNKSEIIGTYHTHLISFHCAPSFKDMTLLMANPGKPHLILCSQGLFAYIFKSFKKLLCPTFPMRISLDILFSASIDELRIEKIP